MIATTPEIVFFGYFAIGLVLALYMWLTLINDDILIVGYLLLIIAWPVLLLAGIFRDYLLLLLEKWSKS